MAAITTASLIYSRPFITKVGGLLFTITNIEIPATTEEYEVGGFEIELSKLGLTDGVLAGPAKGVFETEEKANLKANAVGAIWSSPLVESKFSKAEAAGKIIPTYILPREGKNPLVFLWAAEAAKEPAKESLKANMSTLKEFIMTVYAFGK